MNPIRYDPDGVPLFSSTDVYDYGLPETWGFETYRVIESRDVVFGSDYKLNQSRDWTKIHRYNREARFRTTLLNLLGERTNIPNHVVLMVKCYLKQESKNLWNDTRSILKHFKMRKYYDSIPAIIKTVMNKRLFEPLTFDAIEAIINDFKALVQKYEKIKHDFKRKYFPNIRFIVLKLLELHSVKPLYKIPFVRTTRKNKLLSKLWDSLLDQNE